MTSGVGDKRPASALDTTARPPSLADDATAAAADAARHRSQHLARHRLVLAEPGHRPPRPARRQRHPTARRGEGADGHPA
jgi:hypothetical protein